MSTTIKTWFEDLKTFNWRIFFALCLLSLVPAIYQTVITYLITSSTSAGALDIVGQMEWFDLIDETICAFLIVPMYSVLTKAYKEENFAGRVFKLGIIIFALYALFSVGVFFYGIHLIGFMNQNEVDISAAYRYLSLETIALMIGILVSYINVVFLVVGKAKNMYAFLVIRIVLSLLSDFLLIPHMGIDGIALSNIISNAIMAVGGIVLLILEKNIAIAKFDPSDIPFLKNWGRTGLFAGGQQFLDNIIYALMVVRMVNAVSESGNYWVANNFIWGWLLIPITAMVEIIRDDEMMLV